MGDRGHPSGFEAGYFVKPAIFVNVENNITIAQEEILGSVLCVITYDSEDETIRIANDTRNLVSTPLSSGLTLSARVAWLHRFGPGAS